MKPLKAAGAIFVSKGTKRILLNLRASKKGSVWGFFGGKLEDNETPLIALSREVKEEIGFLPKNLKTLPIDIFRTIEDKFTYYSFIVLVEEEFIPILQEESDGYCWVNLGKWPKPLHAGANAVLNNPSFIKNIEDFIK